jgi:hypothetical protein
MRPYLKNDLKVKRTTGVVQMIEHLPTKHKALSSNPSTTKKIKNTSLFTFLYSMSSFEQNAREKEFKETK